MSCGFVIIAHNNNQVNYLTLARICASRIKKFLNKPVTLITDRETYTTEYDIFDTVKIVDVDKSNTRIISGVAQKFYNLTREDVYFLSPYDETIIVDVDYLVNSDVLNHYFGCSESFMMASDVHNLHDYRTYPIFDKPLKWATTIYFKKDIVSKSIFEQVKLIRQNYNFYKKVYKFPGINNFRNDHAFTIAEHIVKGMSSDNVSLPKINFLANVSDEIIDVIDDTYICYVGTDIAKFKGVDLHFFNKQTIIKFEDKLL